MEILATILPVFFMIGLGIFAKKKDMLTAEQAEGVNRLVGEILFPIMIFNATFTADIEASALLLVGFVFLLHIIAIGVGKLTGKFTGGRFSNVSPFLMCSVDGGNVCFPLYATIVGASYIGNIVLLDIACMFIVYLIVPLLVSVKTSEAGNVKEMLKGIILSPLVISLVLGFVLHGVGLYGILDGSEVGTVYTEVVSMATGPIVALILFMIGFQFKVEKSSIAPLVKCVLTRMAVMAAGIFVIVHLFHDMMQDEAFLIAILLYFMCPPALVMTLQVKPLCRTEEETSFMSAFISVYMIVTLIIYTAIVIAFR